LTSEQSDFSVFIANKGHKAVHEGQENGGVGLKDCRDLRDQILQCFHT
jgi:hypothetical protein